MRLKSLNPSKGNATAKMDIVFMRNVLIYFNAETKKAVFAKVKLVLQLVTESLSGGTLLKPSSMYCHRQQEDRGTQNSGH